MERAFRKALGAAILVATLGPAAVPLGAQQASPGPGPTVEEGAGAGARLPDSTVQRTGAAIRDLSGIQMRYNQRMQSAQPAERDAIEQEANNAAQAALTARGITVDEYNDVVSLAQNDQSLRERLVSAARGTR